MTLSRDPEPPADFRAWTAVVGSGRTADTMGILP